MRNKLAMLGSSRAAFLYKTRQIYRIAVKFKYCLGVKEPGAVICLLEDTQPQKQGSELTGNFQRKSRTRVTPQLRPACILRRGHSDAFFMRSCYFHPTEHLFQALIRASFSEAPQTKLPRLFSVLAASLPLHAQSG